MAKTRGRRRRLLVVLSALAVVTVSVIVIVPPSRSTVCHGIGAVGLDRFVTGCRATAALEAGARAQREGRLREALVHFRAAAEQDAAFADAHLARAEAADILGEFDEALDAYRTAAGLAQSRETRLKLASMAERVGQTDPALLALEGTDGSVFGHASSAAAAGAGALWRCATHDLLNIGMLWKRCAGFTVKTARGVYRASRETVAQYRFRILVEAGRHGAAVDLARRRGWMPDNAEYCKTRDVALAAETLAVLAMLTQPERADCVVNHGVRFADEGLTRLARVVLVDRMANSTSGAVRRRAQFIVRYRLPAHDVPKRAESLNVTGYRLQYAYKNVPEALAVYRKAIAADPRFSWPYHNVARVYLEERNDTEALGWTTQALAVNPDHWRAVRTQGAAYHGLGRYADALAAFSRAAEIDPSDAASLADLGRTLIKLGREAEGVRTLQRAVQLDPKLEEERRYVDAHVGGDARGGATPVAAVTVRERPAADVHTALTQAQAAFGAGRFADALEAMRRASHDTPDDPSVLIGRASMAEFLGEFDEAQAYYAKAAALTPADPALLYRMASFAVRTGEYERAMALLDRVRDGHPLHARLLFRYAPAFAQPRLMETHANLAHIIQVKIDILMEKGDLAGARNLARAHAIVRDSHAYCADARKVAHGSSEEVFHAFRLSTLGQPDAADCIWWYGQWLTDQGYVRLGRLMVLEGGRVTVSETNKASAARYLRVRLGGARTVPKRAEQLFLIARQRYLRDGDRVAAVRLLEEVMRLAPDFARPFDYRARVALEEGDAPAAVAWLERGIAVDPDSWRTRRNLGRLLADLGRTDDAEPHLRKAIELFDEDAGARLALARVLYAQKKFGEYETNTRVAIAFAKVWNEPLPEVQTFLGNVERLGPGPDLPPAPDPRLILGWNYD